MKNSTKFWLIVWFSFLLIIGYFGIRDFYRVELDYRNNLLFWTSSTLMAFYSALLTIAAPIMWAFFYLLMKFNNWLNSKKF